MGQYSVKSAYMMIQDEKENNSTSANSGFWRKLWNLKVPPKTKNFLWRASTGCLPTKDQLRIKKVDICTICPSCNVDTETVMHTLVNCSFAQACWDKVGMAGIINEATIFASWLAAVFEQCGGEEVRMRVMICWSLWRVKNELVWNQKGMDVSEVVVSAKLALNQWSSTQDSSFDSYLGLLTQEDGVEYWQAPNAEKIKVNVDAAIFEDSNCYSYAMVVRDHNGILIEASSRCVNGTVAPEMAEVMGIREALSWVKEKTQVACIIETDCLLLVQAIRSSSIKLSYLGKVIEECKNMLTELKDRDVSVRFVRRSANKVAHYIARYSCSPADRRWRVDNAHSEFNSVLSNDLK